MNPVKKAFTELVQRPAVPIFAAACAAISIWAAAAAVRRAGHLGWLALSELRPALLARSVGVLGFGLGFALLFGAAARAWSLMNLTDPARSSGSSSFWLALGRLPRLISLRAIEWTIEGSLVLGAVVVLARGLSSGTPARMALIATVALVPPLALVAFSFAAARVAVVLVIRGVPLMTAIANGYDFAFAHPATLLRLSARLALATLPFALIALVLCVLASRLEMSAAAVLIGIAAANLSLATLFCYSALGQLMDADGRLTG